MKKKQFIPVLFSLVFSVQHLTARDTARVFIPRSVALEEMAGNQRQFLQLIVNKLFAEKKKIGLLSISSYAADYKNNLNNNEFQNTALIYHPVFKGFSINSGVSFTSADGLKNFVGLQFIIQRKSFSFIYLPGYYFMKNKQLSNIALIEFKPAVNTKWSLYSRLQLHYNHDFESGGHYRSYVYSRLGMTRNHFGFGLAHNFDRYGSDKNTKNNYGVFLKLSL